MISKRKFLFITTALNLLLFGGILSSHVYALRSDNDEENPFPSGSSSRQKISAVSQEPQEPSHSYPTLSPILMGALEAYRKDGNQDNFQRAFQAVSEDELQALFQLADSSDDPNILYYAAQASAATTARASQQASNGSAKKLLNFKSALGWLEKAADLGHTDAADSAGSLSLVEFEGHKTDRESALKWYKKASDAGHVMATLAVAEIYERDAERASSPALSRKYYKEALKWFEKAAERGSEIGKRRVESAKAVKQQKRSLSEREKGSPQKSTVALSSPASQGKVLSPLEEIRLEYRDLCEPVTPLKLSRYKSLYERLEKLSLAERQEVEKVWVETLLYLSKEAEPELKKVALRRLVEEWSPPYIRYGERRTSQETYVKQLVALLWEKKNPETAVEILKICHRYIGAIQGNEVRQGFSEEVARTLAEALQMLGYYQESQPYVTYLKRSKKTNVSKAGESLQKEINLSQNKKPSSKANKKSKAPKKMSEKGKRKSRKPLSELLGINDTPSSSHREESRGKEVEELEEPEEEIIASSSFTQGLDTLMREKGSDKEKAKRRRKKEKEVTGLNPSEAIVASEESATRGDALKVSSSNPILSPSIGQDSPALSTSQNVASDESTEDSAGSTSSTPCGERRGSVELGKKRSEKSTYFQRTVSAYPLGGRPSPKRETSQRLIRTESKNWDRDSSAASQDERMENSSKRYSLMRTISSEHLVGVGFKIRFGSDKVKEDLKLLRSKKNTAREAVNYREILEQLKVDPFKGIGHPHPLTADRKGQWARDLEGRRNPARLVYTVDNGVVTIYGIVDYHK